MKSLSKVLLVGAIAVMAIAVSVAPSEAKKKKMKGPAPGTYVGQLCSTGGKVMICASGGTAGRHGSISTKLPSSNSIASRAHIECTSLLPKRSNVEAPTTIELR